MNQTSLLEVVNAYLETDDVELPVYSGVAARVQRLAGDPNSDAAALERALLHDPALAGQVLKVANSAFFAGLARIETVRNAIVRLGSDRVVELAVAISQKSQFRAADKQVSGYLGRLWIHSLGTALGARWLAERTGAVASPAEAFMAGLLHDIGKLVVLKALDDCRATSRWNEPLSEAVVFELLDTLHANHGGALIEHWNLPESYARVTRSHHHAVGADVDPLAVVVRVADLACTKLGLNLQPDADLVLSATPEAELLGIDEIALAELEILLEDNVRKLAA